MAACGGRARREHLRQLPRARRRLRRQAVQAAVRALRRRVRGRGRRQSGGRARGRGREPARRGRLVRGRPLYSGARARGGSGPGRLGALAGDRDGRPRARLDPRRSALPPESRRLLALDARRPAAALRAARGLALGDGEAGFRNRGLRRDDRRPVRRPAPAQAAAPAAMSRLVLVTGGAGFIGSNLVRALLERGDRVRVLDNLSTGNRANLAGLTDDVELVEGELRSYERVHAAVRGTELVFHQGALPSVPRSVQDPLTTSAVNVEGTLNVLLAARDDGVRRVVFASSSSVYGSQATLPLLEIVNPDPISPYGVAKL